MEAMKEIMKGILLEKPKQMGTRQKRLSFSDAELWHIHAALAMATVRYNMIANGRAARAPEDGPLFRDAAQACIGIRHKIADAMIQEGI